MSDREKMKDKKELNIVFEVKKQILEVFTYRKDDEVVGVIKKKEIGGDDLIQNFSTFSGMWPIFKLNRGM